MDKEMPIISPGTNWPGEREPAHDDVAEASDVPEPAYLSEFKSCLLADLEAQDQGYEDLMHLDLHVGGSDYSRNMTRPQLTRV